MRPGDRDGIGELERLAVLDPALDVVEAALLVELLEWLQLIGAGTTFTRGPVKLENLQS